MHFLQEHQSNFRIQHGASCLIEMRIEHRAVSQSNHNYKLQGNGDPTMFALQDRAWKSLLHAPLVFASAPAVDPAQPPTLLPNPTSHLLTPPHYKVSPDGYKAPTQRPFSNPNANCSHQGMQQPTLNPEVTGLGRLNPKHSGGYKYHF
jgi:hypothetical protein